MHMIDAEFASLTRMEPICCIVLTRQVLFSSTRVRVSGPRESSRLFRCRFGSVRLCGGIHSTRSSRLSSTIRLCSTEPVVRVEGR